MVTVPSVPFTIGITVHCFFTSLARSWYLSLFLLSFSLTLWSTGTANSTIRQVLIFVVVVVVVVSLGLVVWLRLGGAFISQNPKEFCVSYFQGRILGYAVVHLVKFPIIAHPAVSSHILSLR